MAECLCNLVQAFFYHLATSSVASMFSSFKEISHVPVRRKDSTVVYTRLLCTHQNVKAPSRFAALYTLLNAAFQNDMCLTAIGDSFKAATLNWRVFGLDNSACSGQVHFLSWMSLKVCFSLKPARTG